MGLATVALLFQTATAASPTVPFAVGETLTYGGRFSGFNAGTATMQVVGTENYRGVPSWQFSFISEVAFNVLGFSYQNRTSLRSTTGVGDFASRRFEKVVEENTHKPNGRTYRNSFDIFPDSGYYRHNQKTERHATPATPLDDVAFFYWIRTVPLEVGRTYRYNNYFRTDVNPVEIKVEKREKKKLPDGREVQTLLLRPIVDEENGMFSKKSKAKLWLTDDAARIPVEIESSYYFGTIRLVLESISTAR